MGFTSEDLLEPRGAVCPECVFLWDRYRNLAVRTRRLRITLKQEALNGENVPTSTATELKSTEQRCAAVRRELFEHQRTAHQHDNRSAMTTSA